MTAKKPAKAKAAAPEAEAKPQGRPSTFTQAIADEICERLADGEPLRQICRDERMPAWRTVYDWKAANEEFSTRIARARELGHDAIAQECLSIADYGLNDTYLDDEGNRRTDTDVIQRSKLRIETRLKLLSKWDPKRYGDKMDLNHGGQDGNPVNMNWQIEFVKPRDEG